MQEGAEEDKTETEGAAGVQREVALLQARLCLLATYALVSSYHFNWLLCPWHTNLLYNSTAVMFATCYASMVLFCLALFSGIVWLLAICLTRVHLTSSLLLHMLAPTFLAL